MRGVPRRLIGLALIFATVALPCAAQETATTVPEQRLQGPVIMTSHTFGNFDTACTAGIIANGTGMDRCEVAGYKAGLAGYANYDSVDSVALYVANASSAPDLTLSDVKFPAATRIALSQRLTPAQLSVLHRGQHVTTNTTPPLRSEIAGWDEGGAYIDLIEGWARAGDASPGQTPVGRRTSDGGPLLVYVNRTERVWALNANVGLAPGGTQSGVGFELGMINGNQAPPETTWGFDSVNLSCRFDAMHHPECMTGSAFIARGDWQAGFRARAGRKAAFMVDPDPTMVNGIGLLSIAQPSKAAPGMSSTDFIQLSPAQQSASFRVTDTGKVFSTGLAVLPEPTGATAQPGVLQLNSVSAAGTPHQAYVTATPEGGLALFAPGGQVQVSTGLVVDGQATMRGPFVLTRVPPSKSSDPCGRGEIAGNGEYLFFCVRQDHWRRVRLEDF